MEKLRFAYHCGHFDSLGICQECVKIVGLCRFVLQSNSLNFFSFLDVREMLVFAYRFGHFDSWRICQTCVGTVGLCVSREAGMRNEENKKTEMRSAPEGTTSTILARGGDMCIYIYIYVYNKSVAIRSPK